MRPTHSQMLTLSDDSRANIAGVPAFIVSGILVFGFDFDPLGSGPSMAASLAPPTQIGGWGVRTGRGAVCTSAKLR